MSGASWAVSPSAVAMVFFWAWFIVSGLTLSVIDLRIRRLPNRLVALTLAVAVSLLFSHEVLNHSFSLFGSALLGALALVAAYGGLHLLGGIGMGDVKYAAVIGLYLGSMSWSALWWGTLIAFLLATGASVWSISIGRRKRDRSIPFGPAMVAGTVGGALISLGGG